MRRVVHDRYGGPNVLRLEDAPTPSPGSGEVLVCVEAAGASLPAVRQLRGPGDLTMPNSPGGEIAGRVVALGADTSGFEVGQRVAGVTFRGAYAEFATAPATLLTAVPDGIDSAAAATIARKGLVALGVLKTARLAPGETVLVTAAAGGVGHLVVQLAVALGAGRVVAAVGSADKADFVRSLGADDVVGYEEIMHTGPVDVVAEGVGGDVLRDTVTMLAPFGRQVFYSAAGGTIDAAALLPGIRTVTGFSAGSLPTVEVARMRTELWELACTGGLRPMIHAQLPLEQISEAYRIVAARQNRGNVVIRP